MGSLQKENDRKYLVYVSRKIKAHANRQTDEKVKQELLSYSKSILDISSRMISKDEFLGKVIRTDNPNVVVVLEDKHSGFVEINKKVIT